MVWHLASQRWYCFFQEHILFMAVSDDPDGRPGTWKKFSQGRFSEPGLCGRNSPIPALAQFRGANPSVHFNNHLELWLMTWHNLDGGFSSCAQ